MCEIKEVRIGDLIPFKLQSPQAYHGERLEQLASSINNVGLMTPIIVRPIEGGKYEIICGHNRTNAMRELGRDTISADVREDLSDDEALGLFYDSNLNQQSFSDWNYSQKIKAIQYTESLIKKNSQQGKRSDLLEKKDTTTDGETSVQGGHKSEEKSRRNTTRDRMARRMGIATATLSKYRSIIKLPEDLIEVLARLLDEKEITFEAAYRISRVSEFDARTLLDLIKKSPGKKIDIQKLKSYDVKNVPPGSIQSMTPQRMESVLISPPLPSIPTQRSAKQQ